MSNKILKYFIAIIWFANGFYCKILNQIPRHQEIVSRILSDAYAREITFTIGVLEIFMMIINTIYTNCTLQLLLSPF